MVSMSKFVPNSLMEFYSFKQMLKERHLQVTVRKKLGTSSSPGALLTSKQSDRELEKTQQILGELHFLKPRWHLKHRVSNMSFF